MKVLKFNYDINLAKEGLGIFADSIKLLVYKKNEKLFEGLEFYDDRIFLEPALFYYFKVEAEEQAHLLSLNQILWGYQNDESTENLDMLYVDPSGKLYAPNLGVINVDDIVEINKGEENFLSNFRTLDRDKFTRLYQLNGDFDLCDTLPEILVSQYNVQLNASLSETHDKFKEKLQRAFQIIQQIDVDFYSLIKLTTREVALFDSSNTYSFAALSYFGTSFINIFGKENPSEVFFIEDIAHQCGHVMFYPLVRDGNKYLRVDKDTPIKEFTIVPTDDRTVYGVLHGLFTYSTILHLFHLCVQNQIFTDEARSLELYGRMGFYARKFLLDLGQMNNNNILTEEGMKFFDQFFESYLVIRGLYNDKIGRFKYHGQEYIYDNETFLKENF